MRLSAFVLLAALVAGCVTSSPPRTSGGGVTGDPPPSAPPAADPSPGADVLLDGVSVLGTWVAVGALDEPEADGDLRSGLLVRHLTVERGGAAMLSGEDRRAGTEPETYAGRITGSRLAFDDLPGEARLGLRTDGRLVFTDPRGRRTVYERE